MLDHFHKLLHSSVSDRVHILLYGSFFFVIKDLQSNGMAVCSPFKGNVFLFVFLWVC